jgi:hypothetical protein
MTNKDDPELKRLREGIWNGDELDNGSTTDTLQWCELHRGHCHDVVPVRRCFDNPNRRSIIFFACQSCIRDLKKAGLIDDSKYAGLECYEIVVPKGLSKGQGLELSYATRDRYPESRKTARSRLRSPRAQHSNYAGKRSYEVTLDALQVKYLRALGLRVIKA